MIIGLLALAPLAVAQTPPPTGVDPAYLDYLDALNDLVELNYFPPDPPFTVQLDTGTVALRTRNRDGSYADVGRVRVTELTQYRYVEEYFYLGTHAFDPGASFAFEYLWTNTYPVTDLPQGYQTRDYIRMGVQYAALPNQSLWAPLDYEDHIDRWTFTLEQDGVVVGYLHREWHHVPSADEEYWDHWVFKEGFELVSEDAPEAEVNRLYTVQIANTAGFYQWLQGKGPFVANASIRYTIGTGADATW